jgi:SOS response regulatory protein OraA/RecX
VATQLRSIATTYLTNVSPADLQTWVGEITGGTRTMDQFQQAMATQAEQTAMGQKDQSAANLIAKGFTPQAINNNRSDLATTATGYGVVGLTTAELDKIADAQTEYSWSTGHVREALSLVATDASAADVITQIRNAALPYMVTLDPSKLLSLARGLVAGTQDQQSLTEALKDAALARYASRGWGAMIQSGITPQAINSMESQVRSAQSGGVRLDPTQLLALTRQGITENWGATQIAQHVGALASTANAATLFQTVQGMSDSYGLHPSAAQLQSWVSELAEGTNTQTNLAGDMAKQAAAALPADETWKAKLLLANHTLSDITNAEAQVRAAEGPSATGINLSAPQVAQLTERALTQRWSATVTQQQVAALATPTNDKYNYQQIANAAASYGVHATPAQLMEWTKEVSAGTSSVDEITSKYISPMAAQADTARGQGAAAGLVTQGFTPGAISNAQAAIQSAQQQTGVRLSAPQINQLMQQAVRMGWSADKITLAVGQLATKGNDQNNYQQIINAASSYGVTADPAQVQRWLREMAAGTLTLAQVTTAISRQAAATDRARGQTGVAGLVTQGYTPSTITNIQAEIQAAQGQTGVRLSAPQINQLMQQAVRMGWGADKIALAVGQMATSGNDAATLQQIRHAATSYGVTPDPTEVQQWLREIASGTLTISQVQTALSRQAAQVDRSRGQTGLAGLVTRGFLPTDIANVQAQIQAAQQQTGVRLSAQQISMLTQQAVQNNWGADKIQLAIGQLATTGNDQQNYQQIQQAATQFPGLTLDPTQVDQWLREMAAGTLTIAQVTTAISQLAATQDQTAGQTGLAGLVRQGFLPTDIHNMVSTVHSMAAQNMVGLSAQQIQQIAYDAIQNHWTTDRIQQAIGAQVYVQPPVAAGQRTVPLGRSIVPQGGQPQRQVQTQGQPGGTDASALLYQLRQEATKYLVNVPDSALQRYAQAIAGGTGTMDAFDQYLAGQATMRYPGMAAQIKQGQLPSEVASQLQNLASSTLEVDPSQVNFIDNPQYAKLLDGGQDGGMMSYSQAGDYLRRLPAYATTTGARSSAADLETAILQAFGRV